MTVRPVGVRRDDLAWSFFAIPSKLVSKLPDEQQPPRVVEEPL